LIMGKKEIDEHLDKMRRDADRIQEQQRLAWLQQVYRQAHDDFSFKSLGELIAFMVDHAGDIQLKSGDS